jgi:hypothetical protein
MPGSEHRVSKDERRDSSTTPAPRAEAAKPVVDQDALARIRQEELDEQWRNGGRYE